MPSEILPYLKNLPTNLIQMKKYFEGLPWQLVNILLIK